MDKLTIAPLEFLAIPRAVIEDPRVGPVEESFMGRIHAFPRDESGAYIVNAVHVGRSMKVTPRTVIRVVDTLEKFGYLQIVERRVGNNGGFKIRLLQALIAALLTLPPALHNFGYLTNPSKNAQGCPQSDDPKTVTHIISQRKKRARKPTGKRKKAIVEVDPTTKKAILENRLGQLGSWIS